MAYQKKAVIINDTSYEPHHGCELVMNAIKTLLHNKNIKIIDTNSVEIDWRENSKFIKNMIASDLVVVNGEGTLHHSQPRAIALAESARFVKEKTSARIVLINATIHSNNKEFYQLLNFFDIIFVRESLSKKEISSYGIKSTVVPDLSFYFMTGKNIKKTRTKNICITDSVNIRTSRDLYSLSVNNNYIFLPILKDYKFNGIGFIWVFFRFKMKKIIIKLLDLVDCRLPYELKRIVFYKKSYNDYIEEISNCRLIVAARYHSLCFALKTNTPFVAIRSNSHKIEGTLKDAGVCSSRVKNAVDDFDAKLNYTFTKEELNNIDLYCSTAFDKIESMFTSIEKLVINYDK